MPADKAFLAELRRVLECADSPDRLDGHPWTASLLVAERLAADPGLGAQGAGHRLLAALAALFRESRPAQPPRRGKRLDTAWGQFGLLGALYFAPFETGAVRPRSRRDAWGRLDAAIGHFVFGDATDGVPEAERRRYALEAGEPDDVPTSTLSDWHVKGLENLAGRLRRREAHLSARLGCPSPLLDGWGALAADDSDAAPATPSPPVAPARPAPPARATLRPRHTARWAGALIVIVIAASAGYVGRVALLAGRAGEHVARLGSALSGDLDARAVVAAGPEFAAARRDLGALRRAAGPLAWLPGAGGDLAQAGRLLQTLDGLAVAADESAQGLALLVDEAGSAPGALPEVVGGLASAAPHWAAAHAALSDALAARERLRDASLSPASRALVETLDARAPALLDGLTLLRVAPELLGAGGPRTYLLLAQDEAELRATGGFVAAAGKVTLVGGQVVGLSVEEAYAVDDLSKPYFYAPEPLRRYMAAELWLLRDVNWSPDFPTAARLAEALYTYTRPGEVDGVLAFDTAGLRLLLAATGPLELGDPAMAVSADNLLDQLRADWAPPPLPGSEPAGRPRPFVARLAEALVAKINANDPDLDWERVAEAVRRGLAERHLLLLAHDPATAERLAGRGWDGALRAGTGDYLLVVDSNLGFNKADAAVETSLTYTVDLTDPAAPTAELTVVHANPPLAEAVACRHAPAPASASYAELIPACYWDYLRVYVAEGARLLEAAPHAVPGEWLLLGEAVPAQVDSLERVGGAHGFGTLLVVPAGERLETRFRFALPASALQPADGGTAYVLRVQQQPGARPPPLGLRVRLPAGARVVAAEPAGQIVDGEWRAEVRLGADLAVRIVFR